MIRILGIDHLVLRVTDLEAMVRFYCEVLGCVVARRQEHLGMVQLRAGRSLLDLVEVKHDPVDPGEDAPRQAAGHLDHFCFRVEPFDEEAIRGHLAVFHRTAGATAWRFGAEGEGPSLYLEDPEGNKVELKGPSAT